MNYITIDPDELWVSMVEAYVDAGGEMLYPGDEKEILLRGVLAVACGILSKVNAALAMDTLDGAVRGYLDAYGEKRGCQRIRAVAAKAAVTLTFEATETSGTIPAGSAMTADGQMLYALDSDVAYTGAAMTADATITCETAGEAGNALLAGAHLTLVNAVDGVTDIVVTAGASGGRNAEDDETYRERIRTYGLTTVTTGPASTYEAAAKAVSTQVLDAAALNDGAGEVGVYLVISADAVAADVIAAVEAALSADDVRPLTDHVTVTQAEAVAYTLHVTAHYPSSENLESAIEDAVDAYQSWQDNAVGRAFNPDRLTASLFQLGCTRVSYASGDGISGGGAVYTEIAARKHCSGTITVSTVGD